MPGFFDVRVFNPYASSNCLSSPAGAYKKHEQEKRRKYEQRVSEIEQGSFTPLVFLATGEMGKAAGVTYKRLENLIATKQEESYSIILNWIRLSFSLLRSAIMCLQGSRLSYSVDISETKN